MDIARYKLSLAAGFFLLWLCILYMGADHPPPIGFLWVVLLDLVASLLVYLRVPTYADWHATRRPRRVLLALRDGVLTGFAFGVTALVFSAARPGSTVALGWEPVLIWFVVLTLVGATTAALVYAFISLASGRSASGT
jgi:hypothetical protein